MRSTDSKHGIVNEWSLVYAAAFSNIQATLLLPVTSNLLNLGQENQWLMP